MPRRFNQIMRAILGGGGGSQPSFTLVASSPQYVNIVQGTGRGTITTAQGGNIKARVSPSRTTGVAPLYVNFDCTATTKTGESNPEHNLFYAHDFGDVGAGTWANGVQSSGLTSKNAGFGPVSGHVYETPGTYVYTLIVMDGAETKSIQGTITVQDPNVVYAGTNTICISHSGNFTGAPSGAQQVNTSGNTDMYAAWNTYKASNKRILFCKADSWTQSAVVSLSSLTGTTLGGYGTGVARSFGSGTLVNLVSSPGIGQAFQAGGSTDCKVCDFKVTANATLNGGTATTADSVGLMWCRVEVFGAYGSFSVIPSAGAGVLFVHDQHCMYECVSNNVYGYRGVDLESASASGAIGTPGIFTATAHPFQQYNKVRLTGTPPAPLTNGTDYYISATNLTANTFCLSATMYPDSPLALSGTGTCTVAKQGLSGGISAFVAMKRGGMMGCYFDSCNYGEQTIRIPYIHTSHINNNYIARPNQGKNVFKIHCRIYSEISGVSSGYSEKFTVTGNVMDMRNGYSYNGSTVTFVGTTSLIIGNGGGSGNERVRNGIVQNNYTYGCLGTPKDGLTFVESNCPNMTIRNNIADFAMGDRATSFSTSYAYTSLYFATLTTSTPDQTIGVRIYNNTLYSNLSNPEKAQFVYISPGTPNPEVDTVTVKNNLWYHPYTGSNPNIGTIGLQAGASPTNVVHSNNTPDIQNARVSPNFATQPPVALVDWRPSTGSYAIDSGTTVPVLKDINMASRVGGTYDLGAVLP